MNELADVTLNEALSNGWNAHLEKYRIKILLQLSQNGLYKANTSVIHCICTTNDPIKTIHLCYALKSGYVLKNLSIWICLSSTPPQGGHQIKF